MFGVGTRGAAPRWDREGRDWPHREHSQFIELNGTRWHVQVTGRGSTVLLLHGAGAASHSFRDLVPFLAPHHRLVIPDLPGHGFTRVPQGAPLDLCSMAGALASLMKALDIDSCAVVGHSAGAAIGARMALEGRVGVTGWLGINPALLPLDGWAGVFFAPAARAVASSPWLPRFLSWSSRRKDRVRRTIEGTGSRLDDRGLELYARLVGCSGHVEGTVRMMAEWDLESLARELTRISAPMLFIVGEGDLAVRPHTVLSLARRLGAGVETVPGLGHLVHEEAPRRVAPLILDFLA
ncbi:MAG: alpha/beta fold hydrolase BchO [Myxococcota bacterium]